MATSLKGYSSRIGPSPARGATQPAKGESVLTMTGPQDEVREWARVLRLDGGKDIRMIARRLRTSGIQTHRAVLVNLQHSADICHQCVADTLGKLLSGELRNRSKSNNRTHRKRNGHKTKIKPVDWGEADNPDPNPWPERMHEFRKLHHLSYTEAGRRANMGRTTWAGIEQEGKKPLPATRAKLTALFREYGVEIGESDD